MITFDVLPPYPAVLNGADVERLGARLGKMLRVRRARSVGVRFVSEPEMRRLNRTFRRKDRSTDVLSFEPESESPARGKEEYLTMGDIAVCPSYAAREARRRGIDLREELVRLLTHGVLHLSGLDHATTADALRMFAKQEAIVEGFENEIV